MSRESLRLGPQIRYHWSATMVANKRARPNTRTQIARWSPEAHARTPVTIDMIQRARRTTTAARGHLEMPMPKAPFRSHVCYFCSFIGPQMHS